MSLRDDVEKICPNWQEWYPNLLEAAVDLGLIRESRSNKEDLDLRRRHRKIREEGDKYFKAKWNIDNDE